MTKDARTYIRLSSELLANVEKIAKDMGVTRSTLMTMYIAQGVKREMQQQNLMSSDSVVTMMKGLGLDNIEYLKELAKKD